jgi:hypothetical protein
LGILQKRLKKLRIIPVERTGQFMELNHETFTAAITCACRSSAYRACSGLNLNR